MRTRDFFLVVTAACLWGTGGLLGAVLAEGSDVPPASVAMWRMLIAGVALSAWVALRGGARGGFGGIGAAGWRRVLVTATLTAIFEVLYFTGIALAGVGLATLVTIGSAPVWVALWDAVALRRVPPPRSLGALGLALVGLVALSASSLHAGADALAGVAVALVTGAAFAGITVVNRAPVPGLGSVRLVALSFGIGGLVVLPVAALTGWGVPAGVDGWTVALVMGLFSTGLAYVAYLAGLVTVPPFVATVVSLLEPLVAAVLGAIVLGERLGWWGVAGGAALAAAVVLLRPQRDAQVDPA
ncbi:DMT family transporter [Demequina sp. NBRC 110056]|uniref:DMT family transporter n=1 Tax=Demequina sp. NBRC 110056 TaxID=1570345 RepID=UPI000A071F20|nr:EamA family transporter [Demequina sp. NBRC 110056]